ncbi:tetratricopeptide repeat protein [Mycolicibacterium smegmatis]|nr:tetratricopeptide repeat protein [Mycolicibacterium smegmatis]MBE9628214.1 tetratricopeptide repeat protein [Mycolicibacterium smegmatis]MBE9634650.1 tetratricopeptide repeat protein [Mycolicibacterium smegmatis]MBE9646844.1 tetratricopeptide repeat protein [Mycolicibacterium smegmatis]MBE9653193.1 tetratricopeptide repeat protein [Mycolicibacterium smegmatis]
MAEKACDYGWSGTGQYPFGDSAGRKAHVVGDSQGGEERRPRRAASNRASNNQRGNRSFDPRSRDRRPPRSSGPGRARPAQPESAEDSQDSAPRLSADIEARQLAPEVRRELVTLDKATADYVARHLVAAGNLLDEDPETALAHARAARGRAARIAAVREAVGIAAYHCGDWAQALAELRAARRMGSKSPLLPMIADCERGVGRPERAVELARSPEAEALTGEDADELRIVVAGARADLGQFEQALTLLSTPPLDPTSRGQTAARLFYVYADLLLAVERTDEALQWFIHAAEADVEGVTDAEERITELS